jgi:hypothetical protein
MSSDPAIGLAGALGLAGLALAAAAGDVAADFAASELGTPPPSSSLELRGPVAGTAERILGHTCPQTRVRYWRAGGRTAWVLEARGKMGPIVAGFVIRDDRIERSAVLSSREQRGRDIQSRRFLAQFEGAALRADLALDRRVDGLTGATVSSNAMRNMARLALHLDTLARGPPGAGP